MFRVSVKLVVILLLIVTSGVVVFCVSIPIALQLQDNAMDFVLQELTSATEAVQAVVNRKLRLMENMADVLRKASSTGFLLNDVLQFANWASVGVVQQQLDVSLFTPQGFGLAVTSDTTATISGAASPGYLWVINFTAPGSFLDIVQLPLHSTQTPGMSSWTRINTTFQCQQLAAVLPITSSIDEDLLRWVGVSPYQSMPGGSVQSSLVLGGVVNIGIAAMHPDKAQFVVVGLRGEMLVKSFMSPGVFHDDNGVALLIDTISGAYVAGNLNDATGTVHQNGSAQLLQVADLQDGRIAGFLRAKLHSSSTLQSTPCTALMTCSTPCSFTYWPHLNEVVDNPRKTAGLWDVLSHSFASVRVVDVGPSGHTPHGTIALRLVVVVPSDRVIHNLIDEMQKTSLAPYILMICICAVLTVVVECWLFNDLIRLGEGMLILASVFAAQSDSEPMTLAEELQCNIKTTSSSFFVEFERASQAISTLDREMHMLRAFSTLPTISIPGSKFSPNLEENRHDHTFPFESLTEFSGLVAANDPLPYCAPKGTLWRAPVTFVCAQLHPDFFSENAQDISEMQHRLSVVLLGFQARVASVPGGFCPAGFPSGDVFFFHFNAIERTPKHVLAALRFISRCQSEFETVFDSLTTESNESALSSDKRVPFFAGVASAVAHCGFMGPACHSTFTVVSPVATQAAFMCRAAFSKCIPMLLSWRAMEMAKQQQMQKMRFGGPGTVEEGCASGMYEFRQNAKVIQPGEGSVSSYAFSAVVETMR